MLACAGSSPALGSVNKKMRVTLARIFYFVSAELCPQRLLIILL